MADPKVLEVNQAGRDRAAPEMGLKIGKIIGNHFGPVNWESIVIKRIPAPDEDGYPTAAAQGYTVKLTAFAPKPPKKEAKQ